MTSGKQKSPGATRRELLQGAGLAVLMLAPGVTLTLSAAQAAEAGAKDGTKPKRWAMLIDLSKCPPGCNFCVKACEAENGLGNSERPDTDARWIRKVKRSVPSGELAEVPVMCQHCEMPACVDVCPTGASFKRADGIVLVDKHVCIGCRFCIMACPFKARSFVHQALSDQKPGSPRGKGTAEACTFCVHRLDRGEQPACVELCASKGGGAMVFGDLNDPQSAVAVAVAGHASSEIRSDLGLHPAVHYRNL